MACLIFLVKADKQLKVSSFLTTAIFMLFTLTSLILNAPRMYSICSRQIYLEPAKPANTSSSGSSLVSCSISPFIRPCIPPAIFLSIPSVIFPSINYNSVFLSLYLLLSVHTSNSPVIRFSSFTYPSLPPLSVYYPSPPSAPISFHLSIYVDSSFSPFLSPSLGPSLSTTLKKICT
jgi:hypothetical protein